MPLSSPIMRGMDDLNWLDDDYGHQAWQQQCEELERRAAEEAERYRAANPLWDKCLMHPDRQRDGGAQYCAECRENHRRNYADGVSAGGSEYERHGPEIMGSDGKYRREQRLK